MKTSETTAKRSLDEIAAEWDRAESAANWIKGDLAAEVETSYGENTLSTFADMVETSLSTIQDYRRVALAYPEMSRRLDISWSVHQVFAAQDERFELLKLKETWTVAEAKAAVTTVKAQKGIREAAKKLEEGLQRFTHPPTGKRDEQLTETPPKHPTAQTALAVFKPSAKLRRTIENTGGDVRLNRDGEFAGWFFSILGDPYGISAEERRWIMDHVRVSIKAEIIEDE